MKLRHIAAVSLSVLAIQVNAAQDTAATQANQSALNTDQARLGYAIGADIGKTLKMQNLDVDINVVSDALKTAYEGKPLQLNQEQMQQAIINWQKNAAAEREKQFADLGSKNAEAGAAYLAKNKAKKGVKTTASGLQYRSLENGKGPSPSAEDTVTVDYEGKLVNGEVFDSSYQRGEPTSFKVSQVIPGWQEALQKMKVGDVWEIVIPSNLAYGERGAGGPIGPNETLVFKVHLKAIGDKAKN